MNTVAAIAGGAVFVGAGLTALYGTFIPQSGLWGLNISRGPMSSGAVALTFDDGPVPGCTDLVLDVLAKEKVPAAFFVIGRNVEQNPQLLRRIHAEGHIIGNHTYDHHHLGMFRGPRYWREQIRRTNELVVQNNVGCPLFFRPPVGIKFYFTGRAVRQAGMTTVTWSRRGRDGVEASVDQILTRLVAFVLPGDIITLHDGVDPNYGRRPETTIKALPELITRLRDRGLRFARLDDLIGMPAYSTSEAGRPR